MGVSSQSPSSYPKREKIGPKTVDCVFIGYATNSKACRFLVHKSEHPDIHDNGNGIR